MRKNKKEVKMNNYKLISIILLVLLASLAACTNQAVEDPNLDEPENEENINQGFPAVGGEENTVEDAEEESEIDITGITWQWLRFEDTADLNSIQVTDPSLYTLVLNADGSYNAKVDCNQLMGSYTLEGSSITFEPGITTLAECGPESLYNAFLAHLSNVAGFVIDGDNLVLNLWADGGNMLFAPAE
jgi:heat shock protein HslJ